MLRFMRLPQRTRPQTRFQRLVRIAQGEGHLTNVTPTTSGTTAFTDFADLTFTSATITARGALIYNTQTAGGSGTTDTVVVLDFGSNKSSTSGDFQIVFPTADATNAIIRIA